MYDLIEMEYYHSFLNYFFNSVFLQIYYNMYIYIYIYIHVYLFINIINLMSLQSIYFLEIRIRAVR